jgi:hypothetical protein
VVHQRSGRQFANSLLINASMSSGLETVLNKRGMRQVNFWKLDVEGFEVPALRGAGNYLTEKRIGALYIEMVPNNNHRLIHDHMSAAGYSLHQIDRWGRSHLLHEPPETGLNGLFLPA